MNRALLASLIFLGCGVQDAVVGDVTDEQLTADAPLLGADGNDAAERACHVVLRSVERTETNCISTGCWWTFTGFIDVSQSAVDEGASPRVLYKNLDASTWGDVGATATTGAPAGFVRYRFKLTRNTVKDGMSATAYARANVQLAPYLRTSSGARLFDHNRLPGDFETYAVSQSSTWRVAEDNAVCSGDAVVGRTLDFTGAFTTSQRGVVVAGEPLTLTYALSRLETCRNTHNGHPAWDLRAFVRFNPSGTVVDGTVRGFDAPNGVPQAANPKSVPFTVDVPTGTTSLEVWFHNTSGAGSTCQAWDSNYGANYRFVVWPTSPGRVDWVGNAGSSFSRTCSRTDGVPATVTMDSYLRERACAFVETDVYAPGVTDSGNTGVGVFAQAELFLDGAPFAVTDLQFLSRIGNDWRYQWQLPKTELFYAPKWRTLEYRFRFSTDGRTWTRDVTRTVVRDVSFCNPAWADCTP